MLLTFVQGISEAVTAIFSAACQYSSSLLLLLVTVLIGADCKARATLSSGKKSTGRPLSRRQRARNVRKARFCLALSVFKVGMQ